MFEVGKAQGEDVSSASQVKSAQARGRSARVVRAALRDLWPIAVRNGGPKVFTSHRTLTGLRSLGAQVDSVGVDIRSRKARGFWARTRGVGRPIAHGLTLTEATLNLLKLIAPAAFAD
jgi:hypothetical protein